MRECSCGFATSYDWLMNDHLKFLGHTEENDPDTLQLMDELDGDWVERWGKASFTSTKLKKGEEK